MADKAWVVWYEDAEGPGDPGIYLSQASAEARIKSLLESIIGGIEHSEITLDAEEEEMLNDIKQSIARGDIMGAHGDWKGFEELTGTDEKIHVMSADITP
jgi:hypothetical protein